MQPDGCGCGQRGCEQSQKKDGPRLWRGPKVHNVARLTAPPFSRIGNKVLPFLNRCQEACVNRTPVVKFNNGICAESVRGKSNPDSCVSGFGTSWFGPAHYITKSKGYMYFHLLRIFTFTKPSATRSSETGPGPGGPM